MKVLKLIRHLLRTHRHMYWMLLYTLFYLISFSVLEHAGHRHYHVIHTWLDEQIPFCEYFIVPYFLWFGLMIAVVAWFIFFAPVREYYKLISMLMTGMTIFLAVSLIYPNSLDLRPEIIPSDNIFGAMVAFLYRTDTPTNVLPSIHVFNSIALAYAIHGNKKLKKRPVVTAVSDLLVISIILSTMFLKQHSVIDVALGIVMSVVLQLVFDRVYETEEERVIAEQSSYGRSSGRRRTE